MSFLLRNQTERSMSVLIIGRLLMFSLLAGAWLGIDSNLFECSPLNAEETARKRPNVLFIAVDDMNDWIGCMNARPSAITPNLDRLAERGTLFTNAHTAGVFCAPSRAAIFSGQFA
ncbi:sulfatase-like hydrolase/transferase, partial [Rubripirellula sp.]|nr:sulfatase-like hydrolase/transferase [Rubripirellula sp.]